MEPRTSAETQEGSHETPPSGDAAVRRRRLKGLLESDLELLCRSGSIYLPLLLDLSVATEIEGNAGNVVAEVGGRNFIRTMTLQSLVGSYRTFHPDSYEAQRRSNLNRFSCDVTPDVPVVSPLLKTILFSVTPHFVRRGTSLDRSRLTEEELLELIGKRIGIPVSPTEPAASCPDPPSLRRALAELEEHRPAVDPPPEGVVPARALRDWISRVLEARILEEERERLTRILNVQERLGAEAKVRMRILLHIVEKGGLELDDFGFCRIGAGEDYLIYKHTGEYALKDYYGRLYLFPDCRVAVSTSTTLKPFVLELYKHPFLEGHDSGQQICLRHFTPSRSFSGRAAVEAIQEGINALLYGYSSRRRNGYHSLDGTSRRPGGPGFGDLAPKETADHPAGRRRHILDVDFDDYRIPADHSKITQGKVQITNDLQP